ncbi:MAG: DciA family protein [Gammaproteobacteria bacterium]|nr:DciA family protein [Gammaproteobacteria bacterium]
MRCAGDFLDPDIRRRAAILGELDHAMWRLLPPQARERCRCAGIHHGVLIVIAETGVIATLVRFHQQVILDGLRSHLADRFKTVPLKVQVRVSPMPETYKSPTRRPVAPGKGVAALASAARIVSDRDLSRSLKRLAKRSARET